MKWRKQCYLKLNSGSVHESSYHRQVEMGLTLRDKWSCVIMCLYQVQAALVLEEVIWAVSLSSFHEWHAGQEHHASVALRQERCLLGSFPGVKSQDGAL